MRVENREDQVDVRIALYADKHTGAYDVEVRAAPEGLAASDDLPGHSADVILDGGSPRSEAIAVLTFVRRTSNALGNGPLAEPGCIISAYLYHAGDEQEIFAFDERISEEYTAYYASRGMYYLGVYRVDGPLKPPLGELMVYATSDPEEAKRIGNDDLAPHIVAIEEECRALQDRSRERYVISLLPRKLNSKTFPSLSPTDSRRWERRSAQALLPITSAVGTRRQGALAMRVARGDDCRHPDRRRSLLPWWLSRQQRLCEAGRVPLRRHTSGEEQSVWLPKTRRPGAAGP